MAETPFETKFVRDPERMESPPFTRIHLDKPSAEPARRIAGKVEIRFHPGDALDQHFPDKAACVGRVRVFADGEPFDCVGVDGDELIMERANA